MSTQLSKFKTLGVIVLGIQCLQKLNLPVPRIISCAAKALGVSRKSGYEAAKHIEAELAQEKGDAQHAEALGRENLLLRIQVQVLKYQVEHPQVRFSEAKKHLPDDAKSLCVRILRDFKGKLTLVQIANAIGIPKTSLDRWDKEADDQCQFPVKPERRGSGRHATPQEARQVVETFESLAKDKTRTSMKLEEFVNHYNKRYEEAPLDRRTITRILQAAGLHRPKPRSEQKGDYHGKFTVYFPGAQVAVDGKETTVHFTGESEESVTVVKEVAIDIASTAIVGDVLRDHEDAEGVKRVVVKAREECESILTVLADNRTANTAADAQCVMEEHSELGTIFTFPYHPSTNGYLEGFFGRFARIVGRIVIDDTSRATLARSIVELVWRIFIAFYNYSPRESLDFKGPVEYLKTYTVLPREVEEARKGLREQQRRSRRSREPHPRLSDPVFRALVTRILMDHNFDEVEFDDALRSLVHFDHGIIESASCAFSAYSQRDGFDEQKRHFRYFMGIVRKKQKARDQERRNAAADVLRAQSLLDQNAVYRHEVEKEEQKEREELKTEPEAVILRYAQMLMRGRFRLLKKKCLQRIRVGLRSLRRLGRATGHTFEKLALTIRTLPDFAEDVKEHMVRVLSDEYNVLKNS
jgi:hypothetical protein